MSGLIVRPGDTLVVPVAPPSALNSGERERMKQLIETDMPGVRVIVAEGIAPVPFVYRPDPPPRHHPCCLMPPREPHASWCPISPLSIVDEDELPDEAPTLTKAVRQHDDPTGDIAPPGMAVVNNPVTGRPLGYIRVDDGDDAP